jgi:ribosomal protein S18 acetylase RimI-like enzyme
MNHSMISLVRPLQKKDRDAIEDICYRTGYHGEDLTGTGRFNDRHLFGLLFSLYYTYHERANSFVAEERDPGRISGRIAGYILGTLDTAALEKRFSRLWTARIAARGILATWWRYGESFRALWHFSRVVGTFPSLSHIHEEYPAHLHINLLPEYQRRGIGGRLMSALEMHVKAAGVPGIHLVTSDRNIKAVPFYRAHGYRIVAELSPGIWSDAPGAKGLVFAKKFT